MPLVPLLELDGEAITEWVATDTDPAPPAP